jgi:hypothetical protein
MQISLSCLVTGRDQIDTLASPRMSYVCPLVYQQSGQQESHIKSDTHIKHILDGSFKNIKINTTPISTLSCPCLSVCGMQMRNGWRDWIKVTKKSLEE